MYKYSFLSKHMQLLYTSAFPMSIAMTYIFWENIAKTNTFCQKYPKRRQNDVYTSRPAMRIYAKRQRFFPKEDRWYRICP